MKTYFHCIILLALFTGCSQPTNVIEYTLEDVAFEFDGPLFSGPNTAQAALAVNIQDLLDGLEIPNAEIHSATLKSARIISEEKPFYNISSFVLQFAGKSSKMVQTAVLNPVPSDTLANLNPAKDAQLRDILREADFYAILDADIQEDADTSFTLYGTLTFLLEVK